MSQIQNFTSSMGPAGPILTLTGDSGGAVGPDGAGNINIIGESVNTIGFAQVVGAPGTNSLLILPILSNITTNDATPTTLIGLGINASSSATIACIISGAKADYSAFAGGSIVAVGRREAIGGVQPVLYGGNLLSDSTTGIPVVQAVANGNNIEIQVIGEAGITYDWNCQVTYIIT